jgi:hypothetical protein
VQIAAIEAVQQMPEAVRVRSVLVGGKPQIQRVFDAELLDGTFQEPAQLLNLQIGAFDT